MTHAKQAKEENLIYVFIYVRSVVYAKTNVLVGFHRHIGFTGFDASPYIANVMQRKMCVYEYYTMYKTSSCLLLNPHRIPFK